MLAIPLVALGALTPVIQGVSDAVVINISPTMFFLTISGAVVGIILAAVKFTNWMTAWMTKIESAVGEIPSLRTDRHSAKEKILVLESRADATDKWIEGQVEEERTLKVAMADYINERRQGERRAGGAA